jgi:hypothetical protein
MYQVYYSKKSRKKISKNYSKFMVLIFLWCNLCSLYILYLHCWEENKNNKTKNKSQREIDVERERESDRYRER